MSPGGEWGSLVERPDIRGELAIVGVGETQMTANSGRESVALGLEAIGHALVDAGLRPNQVDGLMVTGGMGGQVDVAAFHRHFGTAQPIWFSGDGGAMTWSATAPHHAALAVREGKAKIIVNVFSTDWATQKAAQTGGGPGQYHRDETMKANLEVCFGWYPQPVYFATIARRHAHQYGTRPEHLGAIAVACRRHANGHPGAVMRDKPLSLEAYLERPPFIEPLRMEDCCLISDGAAAYVMTSADRARDLQQRPAIVEGVAEAYSSAGTYFAQQRDFTATPQVYSAPAAFRMAGIRPADVDVLTLYDPFTITALMQIEDMGFCDKGEGGAFVAGDRLLFTSSRRGGGLPFNTHGGLLSHAYMLGMSHVVELVRQLRGTAANQVAGAGIGVHGGYTGATAGTLVLRRA